MRFIKTKGANFECVQLSRSLTTWGYNYVVFIFHFSGGLEDVYGVGRFPEARLLSSQPVLSCLAGEVLIMIGL